jgi:hypothetical protein
MSTDERVLIRLHDGSEHVGQITRRTSEGFKLDSCQQIPVAEVCVISAAPPRPAKRDPRVTGALRRARTRSATAATASPNPATSRSTSRSARGARRSAREQLLANGHRRQRELAQTAPERRVTRLEFVGVGHLTTADAYLAAQAAARAREHRGLAREALYDHQTQDPNTDASHRGTPRAA